MNYGKCDVNIDGGEAAPYEVFILTLHQLPGLYRKFLKCVPVASRLPETKKLAEPLQVLSVTCLTRPHDNGDPLRTKSWKVQVANKFREHMLIDEAYPNGWSHRRYFPKRTQNAVPPLHPTGSEPK